MPEQAGHLIRINATVSGLPFTLAGLRVYPVPPQIAQLTTLHPTLPDTNVCWQNVSGYEKRNKSCLVLEFLTRQELLLRRLVSVAVNRR